MIVTLQSTPVLTTVSFTHEGHRWVDVPARLWQGHTARGVPVHAYIPVIACMRSADQREFEADLEAHAEASASDLQAAAATDAAGILRRLVISWDSDDDVEIDDALRQARALFGFTLARRCVAHDAPECPDCTKAGAPFGPAEETS